MPTTHDHQPTGHPPATEPHPWGRPLPVGHPGHRPPTRLDIAATGRWFVYATALTLATIVVALVAIAATQPQTTTEAPPVTLGHTTATSDPAAGYGQALDNGGGVDRFTPIEGDTSRYHGPTNQLTTTTGLGRGVKR